ncbi:MAG: zinc-ribbon domain-containing protein [Lachnospiraceae bacterium]|nr:zinc-ribbon domain-containing protein [Lachnospiraceae bacterium]
MIIYYGTKKKLKPVSDLGEMTCTNCGHRIGATLAKEGGYFHIFFIPVFPLLTGYKFIYCPYCGIMKKLTNAEFKELKEKNPPIG